MILNLSRLLFKYCISVYTLHTHAMEQKPVFPPSFHGEFPLESYDLSFVNALMWRETPPLFPFEAGLKKGKWIH